MTECTQTNLQECVKEEHKEQECDSTPSTREMQQKLEIESASKSVIAGVKHVLEFVSKRSQNEMSTNVSILESSRERLVKSLNEETDEMKIKFEENHKKKEGLVKNLRDKLKTKESRMNFLLQEMESPKADMTDSEHKAIHEELHALLKELQSMTEIPPELNERIKYNPGSSDVSVLYPLLGKDEIQQSPAIPVLKHQFLYSGSTIKSIYPISGDQAWINAEGTTILLLLDAEGNIKRSVDLHCKCAGFAVDSNDSLFFTEFDTKSVQQNDAKDVIKSISCTEPFQPSAITLTNSEDLLICMLEKQNLPDGTQSERHFVRKITTTGIKIKDYELDIDRMESFNGFPWKILEHTDGSICVLVVYNDENYSIKFSIIYCIDCTGNIKFKYSGEKDKIAFLDICSDMEGNTLASDSQNRRIHIIDSKGKFVRFFNIAKTLKYLPRAISIIANRLWVGTIGAGILQVYLYDY